MRWRSGGRFGRASARRAVEDMHHQISFSCKANENQIPCKSNAYFVGLVDGGAVGEEVVGLDCNKKVRKEFNKKLGQDDMQCDILTVGEAVVGAFVGLALGVAEGLDVGCTSKQQVQLIN